MLNCFTVYFYKFKIHSHCLAKNPITLPNLGIESKTTQSASYIQLNDLGLNNIHTFPTNINKIE